MKKLFLFDFDGTITNRDSFLWFILYTQPKWRILYGSIKLSYKFLLYIIGKISNENLKEEVLAFFLKGKTRKEIAQMGIYAAELFDNKIIRKSAKEYIKNCMLLDARMIIVSASVEDWIMPLAKKYNMECIATRLNYQNNIFTGKLSGKNCYGEEKVARIRKFIHDIDSYEIYSFGDTIADKQMLNIAQYKFYKYFT
jgi:HAD superfamily hydrolase (TIGR01490 family)